MSSGLLTGLLLCLPCFADQTRDFNDADVWEIPEEEQQHLIEKGAELVSMGGEHVKKPDYPPPAAPETPSYLISPL